MPDSQPPHYLGHRRRLRARFVKHGLDGLAEHEVMELLLTFAIPRADVKVPAKRLLARFGGLKAVLDAPLSELQAVQGVGEVAATGLHAIRAAATAYLLQTAEGRVLHDPLELMDFWKMRLGGLRHEAFAVGYLDTALRLLPNGVEIVRHGSIDRAAVQPREVVAGALKREAAALVLAHNHPNGDVEPSEADRRLTDAIVAAAQAVELRVVDHVVVSGNAGFSFRAAGWL